MRNLRKPQILRIIRIQYVRGVFLSDAPNDADETSTLHVLLALLSPPGAPAGVLRRCGAPAETSLITWGPRSPNPQGRDVRGGATRPPRPVVRRDVRQARPTGPFAFSAARDLAKANLSVGRARRIPGESKAGSGPGLGEAPTWNRPPPPHTHLPVRVAGHGDSTSHVGEGRGFPVLSLPRLGLGGGPASDWMSPVVNPGRKGRRK